MRKFTLISVMAMLLGMVSTKASAYDFEVDGIGYKILPDSTKVEVTAGAYSENIVIPSTVAYGDKTYRVARVGDKAFYKCDSLKSVTLPESVTCIGESAFSGCRNLTGMVIPESVDTIGYEAFYDCLGMTSLVLPNSMDSIANFAFYNCNSLKSVTIPQGLTRIGGFVFAYCSGLTSLNIPEGVTQISGYAFEFCYGLTSVTIAGSVADIGERAFYGCTGLSSVIALMESPFALSDNVFTRDNTADVYAQATLYCPTPEAYSATDGWKNFANTRSLTDDVTGVQTVGRHETNGTEAIYDLNGRRVERPAKGIYIKNGKKVAVR